MTQRPKARVFAVLTVLLSAILLSVTGPAFAQADPVVNPNVVISFPPPVYVVRGQFEVRGTVNLPNLANYFLEFRQLDPQTLLPATEDDPFLPASLPTTGIVIEDVLATWDTTVLEDGLYQLRLTANVSRQGPTHFIVAPLRVENFPPPFVVIDEGQPTAEPTSSGGGPIIIRPGSTPTQGGIVITRPTLAATPTSISNDPIVTANVDANVRSGDSTAYPVVGSLPVGFQAAILGISTSGSGWYYIELDNGRRGFISPTIVTVAGNLANIPRIDPPPVPATPTPTPRPAAGDIIANGFGTVPSEPRCAETFQVQVNVTNIGSATPTSGGILQVNAVHVATGQVTGSTQGPFPPLSPGQNFVVVAPLTLSQFGGEDYRFVAIVDVNGQIAEENENNNTFTSSIIRLRRAGCP